MIGAIKMFVLLGFEHHCIDERTRSWDKIEAELTTHVVSFHRMGMQKNDALPDMEHCVLFCYERPMAHDESAVACVML